MPGAVMTSTIFAALRIARDLEAAGAERRRAETHAEALRPVAAAGRDDLATVRWPAGLLAAFVFAIGLRVSGIH